MSAVDHQNVDKDYIERGQRKPTMETFFKIAEALDMRPSALLAEVELELEKRGK